MFKGIVEATGVVVHAEDLDTTRRFTVEAPTLMGGVTPGDSIAVDGACFTAISVATDTFTVDAIGTTLERTIAGGYQEGSRVNLERAMVLGRRIDGHLVQGHVDSVGQFIHSEKDGEYWTMDFRVPAEVYDLTVLHGSITLNGVSLTVSELSPDRVCRIGVIPFTYQHTNLGDLTPDAPVNIEGDMIGKYVAKILGSRGE
jgi:riboflavin synthase